MDELIADVARCLRGEVPELWDDPDLARMTSEARAALAVDNARRYTHARATALTLQRSLLPRR
ncbi:hypothetical protein [Streptomyces sp. NPDC001307]|uniref:hypothetical protein n=1 Tax=Streptomyces sp. NPDC001307 TaxID=3364560 RepID=UPI0036742F7E